MRITLSDDTLLGGATPSDDTRTRDWPRFRWFWMQIAAAAKAAPQIERWDASIARGRLRRDSREAIFDIPLSLFSKPLFFEEWGYCNACTARCRTEPATIIDPETGYRERGTRYLCPRGCPSPMA